MNWDLPDFVVFGAMVVIVVIVASFSWRRARSREYRGAMLVAALGAFFLLWVNGAVGIIGNESNDANRMFFGVLAVATLGSLIARFRAKGMALTLYATALAQVLVATLAITMGLGSEGPVWPRDILVMTAIFSVFWLWSGWLFSRAARHERRLFTDSPFLR